MHVFYTPDIQAHAELPEEEAAHAVRVLRLQAGDEVMLTDGKGCFYRAEISTATNKRCLVNILETLPQAPLWKGHLHIAMAPTKNMDRTEWFAEKATEIGFDELTFLNCRFSERKVIKTERISKILVSAIKQSLKARLPQLNEMTDFNKFITQPFPGGAFCCIHFPLLFCSLFCRKETSVSREHPHFRLTCFLSCCCMHRASASLIQVSGKFCSRDVFGNNYTIIIQ